MYKEEEFNYGVEEDFPMTIGQAAKFLRICSATLRNWHKAGKLIPRERNKLTNDRIYYKKDLEIFLYNNNRKHIV